MVNIAKDNNVITLIVHFSVERSQQQELIDSIVEFLETIVKHQPGFVSASIHKSLDGMRVVNYAQWRSLEDFQAFANNSEIQSKAPKLFQKYQPDGHTYELYHQAASMV